MIIGSPAWKQGFIYKLWLPPHKNEKSMVNTREPIPGVKYAEGIGSVAKSIVALYGDIPPFLKFQMGFQQVTITRSRNKKQPTIKFTPKKETTKSIV
jgi:hypothetical protein